MYKIKYMLLKIRVYIYICVIVFTTEGLFEVAIES